MGKKLSNDVGKLESLEASLADKCNSTQGLYGDLLFQRLLPFALLSSVCVVLPPVQGAVVWSSQE